MPHPRSTAACVQLRIGSFPIKDHTSDRILPPLPLPPSHVQPETPPRLHVLTFQLLPRLASPNDTRTGRRGNTLKPQRRRRRRDQTLRNETATLPMFSILPIVTPHQSPIIQMAIFTSSLQYCKCHNRARHCSVLAGASFTRTQSYSVTAVI